VSDQYDDQLSAQSGRNGPSFFLILLIIVAAITAVFIAQNREQTQIEFLFFDVESRVWTAIAVSIALGIVLDRLILAWWRRARKSKNDRR
jgi:uncharacterized membrane protein YciS (DUF1049 family)